MRLGDLDALKEVIRDNPYLMKNLNDDNFECILDLIDNAPTVTDRSLEIAQKSIELGRKVGQLEGKLKRPQGEWIEDDNHNIVCPFCSGTRRDCRIDHINFCNRCGAEMQKDKHSTQININQQK